MSVHFSYMKQRWKKKKATKSWLRTSSWWGSDLGQMLSNFLFMAFFGVVKISSLVCSEYYIIKIWSPLFQAFDSYLWELHFKNYRFIYFEDFFFQIEALCAHVGNSQLSQLSFVCLKLSVRKGTILLAHLSFLFVFHHFTHAHPQAHIT